MTEQEHDRFHWRRNTFYVGYLCPCCVRYVHHGLSKEHREWCMRHPQNIHISYKGGCIA